MKLQSLYIISLSLLLVTLIGCSALKKSVVSPEKLMSQTWEMTELFGGEKSVEDFGKSMPFLNFEADGKLTGSTGCNSFSGNYKADSTGFSINPGAMSKMACPGDGEALFLNAISKVASAKVGDKKLALLDESGTELLKFVPSVK